MVPWRVAKVLDSGLGRRPRMPVERHQRRAPLLVVRASGARLWPAVSIGGAWEQAEAARPKLAAELVSGIAWRLQAPAGLCVLQCLFQGRPFGFQNGVAQCRELVPEMLLDVSDDGNGSKLPVFRD